MQKNMMVHVRGDYVPTIESFDSYSQRSSGHKKSRRRKKTIRQNIFVRWDCREGDLVDNTGAPMKDAVWRKAYRYATEDYIEAVVPAFYPCGDKSVIYSQYRVSPLPGCKQEHLIGLYVYENGMVVAGCDCQYCRRKGLLCSHIMGLMMYLDRFPLAEWLTVAKTLEEIEP